MVKGKSGPRPTRRKKQADIEEAIEDNKREELRRNSDLTDDELCALTYQWKRDYEIALADKKAADAELKNVCKRAKAELGPRALDLIKGLILLETPEGEASMRAAIEQQIRIAKWAGAPIGTQFQFFETGGPAVDQAYENGKAAGFRGDQMMPPHDPSVPQYKRWIEGWQYAQSVLMSGFREKLMQREAEPEGVE
jgi:hypothetical protein